MRARFQWCPTPTDAMHFQDYCEQTAWYDPLAIYYSAKRFGEDAIVMAVEGCILQGTSP
jgi:hypothetical protein